MKRSAKPVVFALYAHSLLFEVVKWYWLIPLSRNMHYVDAVIVLNVHVCAIVKQQLDHNYVSSEWSKMKGSETIIYCPMIDPLLYLPISDRLLCSIHDLCPDFF